MVPIEKSDPWIVRMERRCAPTLRLFCFPFAGSGASIYVPWMKQIPQEVEVCSVQPPGREGRIRERAFNQLRPLASAIAKALAPYVQIPFVMFGHSMGATTAFEVTHFLEKAGLCLPKLLIVSGCPAPQLPCPGPVLSRLSDAELTEVLANKGNTAPQLLRDREFMAMVLPTIRADLEAVETYKYEQYMPLQCPIVTIGGSLDRDVSVEQLDAWREQSKGKFSRCMVTGDHLFLLSSQREVIHIVLENLRKVVL